MLFAHSQFYEAYQTYIFIYATILVNSNQEHQSFFYLYFNMVELQGADIQAHSCNYRHSMLLVSCQHLGLTIPNFPHKAWVAQAKVRSLAN